MSLVNGEMKSCDLMEGWKSSNPESYSRMTVTPYYSSSGVGSADSSGFKDSGTYSIALGTKVENEFFLEGELLLATGLF